jgi:hypothetical protein
MDPKIEAKILELGCVRELTNQIVDLKNKLEIAKNKVVERNSQQCWLNVSCTCPYGSPDGRFEWRPLRFCNKKNCSKISESEDGIKELLNDVFLSEWISKHDAITLDKALAKAVADNVSEFDEDEKKLVESVVQMLENASADINPPIYYAEDLDE